MTHFPLHNANTVQFASVRIIAEDLEPLVRFYEAVTGATARWLTDDFVEFVTPSATVAVSHVSRVQFLGEDGPRAAASNGVIYEFLVEDVDALLSSLETELGDDLTVVQPPTMMPWGNISLLIRDPAGTLINLYTPVSPEAVELQQRRQPQLPERPVDREGHTVATG
jgi:predicted enzyme related to lactoylglutathione lyase